MSAAQSFEKQSTFPVPAEALFAWHERSGAFERLCPPWDPVEIVSRDPGLKDGARVSLRVKIAGIPQRLEVIHEAYEAGVQFQDRQLAGPFAEWVHRHQVIPGEASPEGSEASALLDAIRYRLPLGPLGALFGGAMARRRLDQLFHYRHRRLAHDLQLHARAEERQLRVAVSGARGAAVTFLTFFSFLAPFFADLRCGAAVGTSSGGISPQSI